jgi:hypothetical protein
MPYGNFAKPSVSFPDILTGKSVDSTGHYYSSIVLYVTLLTAGNSSVNVYWDSSINYLNSRFDAVYGASNDAFILIIKTARDMSGGLYE